MTVEELPMAEDDMPALPATLKTLALTLETTPEEFTCLVMIGMFGALLSASKLLAIDEPMKVALPATLETLLLIAEKVSDALHFWVELTWVRVGSVEMLAPLHSAWLWMPTLPHTLVASTFTFEPMAALELTICLLNTLVLFMVVMSMVLPAAEPWATASPPTVLNEPFRLDQLFCRLTWPLTIWLPEACGPLS